MLLDMYLRYFPDAFSDDETVRQILAAIEYLRETYPDRFAIDSDLVPSSNLDKSLFVKQIAALPAFESIAPVVRIEEPSRALVTISRHLSFVQWVCEIEIRFICMTSYICTPSFLLFRYLIATHLIQNVLDEELDVNNDEIRNYLANSNSIKADEIDPNIAIKAENEISRVVEREETKELFIALVTHFEDGVEENIKSALPVVLHEMCSRLALEAIVKSSSLLGIPITSKGELTSAEITKVLRKIASKGVSFSTKRMNFGPGGRRETDKFIWTNDRKIEFYEAVASQVHKNGKPLWELAYRELCDKDFSPEIRAHFRTRTALKEVPDALWKNAVKSWQSHNDDSSSSRIPPAKSPKAFAMYFALHKLGFPTPTLSSMKRYLSDGKTLTKR